MGISFFGGFTQIQNVNELTSGSTIAFTFLLILFMIFINFVPVIVSSGLLGLSHLRMTILVDDVT